MVFISIMGFLAAIVFAVMAIVSAIRKTGKGRRFGAYAFASFLIFIVTAMFVPVEEETATTEPKKENKETMEIDVQDEVTISTLDKEVKITGTVKNVDEVKVNGEVVELINNSFEKVVPLDDKQDTVEVAGAKGEDEVETLVTVKREQPTTKLNITSKGESKSKAYDLKGETDQSAIVKLLKDGKEIAKVNADKDGKFIFSKLDTTKAGEYKYEVEVSKEGYKSTKEEHVVTRTLSKKEEQQQLKDSAITIDYKQLEKNKNKHKGEFAKFKGQIVQIMEDADYTVMRVAVDQNQWGWDTSAILYVEYAGTTDFIQDDIVTVYGLMAGEYSYESQAGWNISVPSMYAEIVE